jgi:two-component system, chemotaxis family, chemotaxis protein CheY
MKVLLVDDSGTMRTLQKRCLLSFGLQERDIVEAADGQVALDYFRADHFDIVVTDWIMPVMDGLTLLKEIRACDPQVPVVMVTTESERSRVVAAIEAGASDYLIKPYKPDVLKAKLQKWIPAFAE